MNAYDASSALAAADALSSFELRWFEDVCDPHDFGTQQAVAQRYRGAIAVGEALFSTQEAALLADYGGLRPDRDLLVFDPVHCYGMSGFCKILETMLSRGWRRESFFPHGGHLFTLHVVAGLGLGDAEVNPFSFAPFGGLGDGDVIVDGQTAVPSALGIGFERRAELFDIMQNVMV